jgi:hypothetical protein
MVRANDSSVFPAASAPLYLAPTGQAPRKASILTEKQDSDLKTLHELFA